MEVTNIFGPGGSVLVSDVHCNGTEKELYLCPNTERTKQKCNRSNSAGVICSKSISKCHIDNHLTLLYSNW